MDPKQVQSGAGGWWCEGGGSKSRQSKGRTGPTKEESQETKEEKRVSDIKVTTSHDTKYFGDWFSGTGTPVKVKYVEWVDDRYKRQATRRVSFWRVRWMKSGMDERYF